MSSAELVVDHLRESGLTVACAESLTGGLLCSELINVPGASAVVAGGVVAYATTAKATVLGVDPAMLAADGPVSQSVARQMAERVAVLFSADVGIATTGVAGPHELGPHPVGEVYIAVSRRGDETVVQRFDFAGTRHDIRTAAVRTAMSMTYDTLRRGVSGI